MSEAVINDIERIAVLKSIDIFKDLEIEPLYQILKLAKYVRFKKSDIITKKGELGESFYVVLEGSAGVFFDLNRERLATIHKGSIIGELSILDKQERTAWVIADKELIALEFNGEEFVSLIKTNNTIAFSMAQTLSLRLRNTLRTRNNFNQTPIGS